MSVGDPKRSRGGTLFQRFHTRFVLLGILALVAALAVGFAHAAARSPAIGTGVVVIDTNLAYSGGAGAGTGMILRSSGEVLTNNHVIRGATTIRIVVPGTGRSYKAKVVGYSVTADVAVLQATGAAKLKTVSLGNSSNVKVGQAVTAVGNAGGTGSITSASGKVTGIARSITVGDGQGGGERLTGLIETNARLEPGDSGGPLLNARGRVVGMDTAASVGNGLRQVASSDAYAIPINRAVAIVRQIERGRASATVHVGTTAFLGISVTGSSSDGSGAVIGAVVAGSPAAAAGLAPGDVITAVAGRAVASPAKLSAIMLAQKPGARVSITYLDATGTSESTTATLASGPPQ